MELLKESELVKIKSLPKDILKDIQAHEIAFVLGIDEAEFHSLIVTMAGDMSFSHSKPKDLCRQLERQWQLYVLPTRRAVLQAWQKTLESVDNEVKPKLGQFSAPLQVASCGTRSFWSPRPRNALGLWFFTPMCQNIEILHDQVTFTTSSKHEVIHWAARIKAGLPLPVSQARVDLLAEFVARKAEATQKVALQYLGQLTFDQGIAFSNYPHVSIKPIFPLGIGFIRDDFDFLITFIVGNVNDKLTEFDKQLQAFFKKQAIREAEKAKRAAPKKAEKNKPKKVN